VAGANDAHGNLAPVGDQDLVHFGFWMGDFRLAALALPFSLPTRTWHDLCG
jgi:hypothetical protein